MYHPLSTLPTSKRKQLFWVFLFITLILIALMNLVGGPLMTDTAPYGIVSYELAGSVPRVEAILASWSHNAQLYASFSLGLDYLFMVAYSTTIGLACLWAADVFRDRRGPLTSLGVPLVWGQWLAALLDAVENLALVILLFGLIASPWPELAKWCAIGKCGLIIAGIIYATLGLVVHLARRVTPNA